MDRRPISLTVEEFRALTPTDGGSTGPARTKRTRRQDRPAFNVDRRRDLAVLTLRNLEGLTKQQVRSVIETALAMLDC